MTDIVLRLRPATPAEFDDWLPRHEAGYAGLIAASGAMSPEEAREKARRDTERVWPAGLDSPGQLLFWVLAGDEPVGTLWLGVPGPDDALMAWVYDVEIDPACRGRGYGRSAMLLAEAEARARGMTSIGLNVHGQNMVARALYDSLGYEVTAQQMKKALLSAGTPDVRRRARRSSSCAQPLDGPDTGKPAVTRVSSPCPWRPPRRSWLRSLRASPWAIWCV